MILFLALLAAPLTSPSRAQTSAAATPKSYLVGHWYGAVDSVWGNCRFVLSIERSVYGGFVVTYDSIEGGGYGLPFDTEKVQKKKFIGRFEGDGEVDLTLAGPDRLKGSLKFPGKFPLSGGKTFPLVMTRGMDYSLPRVDPHGQAVTTYTYQPPVPGPDGWPTVDVESLGGDRKGIETAVTALLDGHYPHTHLHSLLLVRHGKLALEEYFYGYGPQDVHQLQSATKSVLSILCGIAQDRGLLKTGEKLFDFFPRYRAKPDWDPRKEKITLKSILTMTSGFACDDGAYRKAGGAGCEIDMLNSPDWLDFSLSGPMAHDPGQHFSYCTSCLTPLGAVIAQQSRMPVADFAQKYLYDPLGIQNHLWLVGPDGTTEVGASQWMRPRDMAKLGLLYLHQGLWNGKQVVSADWVKESTKPQPIPPDGRALPDTVIYGGPKPCIPPMGIISPITPMAKGGNISSWSRTWTWSVS